MGLEVPQVEILRIGDLLIYVIERYDRKSIENQIIRLVQEDFCQALNFNAQLKYGLEDESQTSTYQRCFHTIKNECINPLSDTKKLLNSIIFNGLTGNSDGHIKNMSLLHDHKGTRLAPFYDIVSTQCWKNFNKKTPLRIDGKRRDFRHIQKHHFINFANEIGIKPSIILSTLETMAKNIVPVSEKTAQEFNKKYHDFDMIHQINFYIKNISSTMLELIH